ncbi:MAG: DUF2442 domain-containing protein [bacterium]
MTISIIKAQYLNDYKIRFIFSDGVEQIINFKFFLSSAKNPMTKKYLNSSLFKKFKIRYGDIEWNDYELCFPLWDLHEGKIH